MHDEDATAAWKLAIPTSLSHLSCTFYHPWRAFHCSVVGRTVSTVLSSPFMLRLAGALP